MAKKSLPEAILFHDTDSGDIQSFSMEDSLSAWVKENKVKDYAGTDEIAGKKARDIVKDFALMHLNATDENEAEIPEGMEKYESLFGKVKIKIDDHKACVTEQAEAKKEEAEAKRQAKEADEKKKKEADALYKKRGEAFEQGLLKSVGTREPMEQEMLTGLVEGISLPKTVTFGSNGMSMQVGEKATEKDIGDAIGAVFGALNGSRALQGALQFAMGDLLNNSVKRGVFRSKGDAASAIKLSMTERSGKSWDIGTIQFYANMAERISAEKRHAEVNPSIYLMASKCVAPRIKTDDKKVQLSLANDFDTFREDTLIEKINNGELKTTVDVQNAVKEFKKSKGLIQTSPEDTKKNISRLLRQLFFAKWVKENLVKDGNATFTKTEDGKETEMVVPVGTITDLEVNAESELQNLLIPDADDVCKGYKVNPKTEKKEVFYMEYPFEESQEGKEEEQQEEKKEEVPAPVAKKAAKKVAAKPVEAEEEAEEEQV